MGFAFPFNLREIGNAVSIWLGIEPYELFFYIFLPPLLLDAALKIDWHVFKKVRFRVQAYSPKPEPLHPELMYRTFATAWMFNSCSSRC